MTLGAGRKIALIAARRQDRGKEEQSDMRLEAASANQAQPTATTCPTQVLGKLRALLKRKQCFGRCLRPKKNT